MYEITIMYGEYQHVVGRTENIHTMFFVMEELKRRGWGVRPVVGHKPPPFPKPDSEE